jgi:DNA-binding PadR family transcriptional regulator
MPNSTAASLLGFLHYGPQSGWDLVKLAETLIGDFWPLTRSQVYRELAAMAEQGLIEAGPVGPRDRRPYSLTGKGRQAFATWVHQEPGAETIRFPLLLTVTFGRHLPPEQLAAFLEGHRRQHAERLADYEQRREDLTDGGEPDPYVLATLDFGLHYERAVLAWFNGSARELLEGAAPPPRTPAPGA